MKPNIAEKFPKLLDLKAGQKYFWCSCWKSKNQPYCDGSHAGTDFKPKMFEVESDEKKALCMCKYTKNPPYCDGSHANLPKEGEPGWVESTVGWWSTKEEPYLERIKALSRGAKELGHHGEMGAMWVPLTELPKWEDIQILSAQMATKPLMEDIPVSTEVVIGPRAKKPLRLSKPLFVSDMSFWALSEEAKTALARGAELAGTGICSGEGWVLPEEHAENSRYFYELASAKFWYHEGLLENVQAFHFKWGQWAKTWTGGHLPWEKNVGKISEVRKIEEGTDAISPPTFSDLHTSEYYKEFADRVREVSWGIPIGFKLSANHIEADIQFALDASADYIILDGRWGGTWAAPLLFRDNISVPTIPALARARKYLDTVGASDVTLIITGWLRVPEDFIKALALWADAVAVSNSAMQAIGCVAARMCNTNNCPAGIATQKKDLRQKIDVEKSAKQLQNFFENSTHLISVMARACGNDDVNKFNQNDITTWKKEMADLSGISFWGAKD